jgi:hypothetical protein
LPSFTGAVDVPASVHAHVGTKNEITRKVNQEMLAGGTHSFDRATSNWCVFVDAVERRQNRLETGDRLARQRAMEGARGAEDGVPFRHDPSTRCDRSGQAPSTRYARSGPAVAAPGASSRHESGRSIGFHKLGYSRRSTHLKAHGRRRKPRLD